MKIAVTYDKGEVFQHFGHTEAFGIYETDGTSILSSEIVSTDGQGHSALSAFLAGRNVDVLICGGIGEGARNALAEQGIKVVAGASGNADEAVRAYLSGTLTGSDETCDHHHGGEEEHCGSCHEEDEGCGGCGGCHGQPTVTGKNVGHKCTVHYRGTFNDGTQFDSSYDRGQPLEFVCGAGMMIHGFDQAVADMEKGQKTDIHLLPEEAYGQHNPQAVLIIPISQLPGSENLNVGERVALTDELGRRFNVLVTEKDSVNITLDANHPMAGQELNFTIELIDVD